MFRESLKRKLAATGLGSSLVRWRHLVDIWAQTLTDVEGGPCCIQDYLSEMLLVRLPAPGTTFVDVGAHVGSILGQVAHHNPAVSLVAIEAVPDKAELLQRQFPSADVHHCAAGDEDGDTEFYVAEHSAYSSLSQGSGTRVVVPMRRLDTLLDRSRVVDILKMDVEGAELRVLRGADATIDAHRPLVVFESVTDGAEDDIDVFEWLAAKNYEVVVPNRLAHDGPPLTREGYAEAHCHPRRTTDYYAVPSERRQEFKERARAIHDTSSKA